MTYTAYAYNSETEAKVEFSVRSDAKLKTLVRKAVTELMPELGLSTCTFNAEMPNVWINGGVGFLMINNKYFVQLWRNDNEILIFG